MKTVTIGAQQVIMLLERGKGSEPGLEGGGVVIRYMVAEADGTYSEVGEWYSDPAEAQKTYDDPDLALVGWSINEARRQTLPHDERPVQDEKPSGLKTDAVRDEAGKA